MATHTQSPDGWADGGQPAGPIRCFAPWWGRWIRSFDDALQPGADIPRETLRAQIDALIAEVQQAVEPSQGAEVVERLGRLGESQSDAQGRTTSGKQAEAARAEVINIVNNLFHEKPTGMPAIKVYIDERQQ